MNVYRIICNSKQLRGYALTVLLTIPVFSFADVTQVSNDELKALQESGVELIDVRRPDEWQLSGVIEGSHLLTFFDKAGRYDMDKWLTGLQKIAPDDQPFVLICEVGGRTGSISKLLDQKLGFTQVHNLTKGIRHWIKTGETTVAHQPK